MRGSPPLSSVVSNAILSRISPTSWAFILVDDGRIECKWLNVSGPSPVLYLSRFDFIACIFCSPGILVIDGIWKYNCIATLIALVPLGWLSRVGVERLEFSITGPVCSLFVSIRPLLSSCVCAYPLVVALPLVGWVGVVGRMSRSLCRG